MYCVSFLEEQPFLINDQALTCGMRLILMCSEKDQAMRSEIAAPKFGYFPCVLDERREGHRPDIGAQLAGDAGPSETGERYTRTFAPNHSALACVVAHCRIGMEHH